MDQSVSMLMREDLFPPLDLALPAAYNDDAVMGIWWMRRYDHYTVSVLIRPAFVYEFGRGVRWARERGVEEHGQDVGIRDSSFSGAVARVSAELFDAGHEVTPGRART